MKALLLALSLMSLVATAAIPDAVGLTKGTPQAPEMGTRYGTLIHVSGDPNVWVAGIQHGPLNPGDTITFGDGSVGTVELSWTPRGGPFATPQGADICIAKLEAPVDTAPVEVWWERPPITYSGAHVELTGVALHDGVLEEWKADGLWHSGDQGEYTLGMWWASPRSLDESHRSYILPGDSGSPVFLDGKYLGAASGYFISDPGASDLAGTGFVLDPEPYQEGKIDGGVCNTLWWLRESYPESVPIFEYHPPVRADVREGLIYVEWDLPDDGFVPEKTTDLANWGPVTAPVVRTDTIAFFRAPPKDHEFFRLTKETP